MKSGSSHEKLWAWWLVFTMTSQALLMSMVCYRTGSIDFGYKVFAILSVGSSLALFQRYGRALQFRSTLSRLLLWAFAVLPTLALCGAAGLLPLLSLELVGGWWLSCCVILGGISGWLGGLVADVREKTAGRVLVVGDYPEVRALLGRLKQQGIVPIGVLGKAADYLHTELAQEWRGEESDIRMTLAWYDVKSVYLAMSLSRFEAVCRLYQDATSRYADVYWAPDFAALAPLRPSVAASEQLTLIGFNLPPRIRNAVTIRIKEVMEWSLAVIALVLFLPLMLIISVAVKLSSPGPVLIREARLGCDGDPILLWKFRSVTVPDEDERPRARRSPSVATGVGRFLRRTSLDELPQLFNVLQGSLALVGPRPYPAACNALYEERIALYHVRYRLKPGMTGLAEVKGCRGDADQADQMQRRVEHDLHYLRHWSLWLDLKILMKTPFVLLGGLLRTQGQRR